MKPNQPNIQPTKAVIYTRVSSAQQGEEGTSLASQYLACLKKAEEIGAQPISHMEEVESGGLYLGRPQIQAALELIETKQADTLIIYKLDRTGRDVDALRDIRRRIRLAGGQLVFADGMQFEKTPVGNLMFTQLGAFAEFEREVIRERTMRGSRARAESGIMPCRSFRPFGYRFVNDDDVKAGTHSKDDLNKYIIVEEEAVWVRRMFQAYAAGASLSELARVLHENGVPTRRGGAFWRVGAVSLILKNPLYKGQAAFGKTQNMTDEARMSEGLGAHYRTARDESEWLYFDAPAIVGVDLWEAARQRLGENRAAFSGRRSDKRLLSGLVRCNDCHRIMPYAGRRTYHRQGGVRFSRSDRAGTGRYCCTHARLPQPCPATRNSLHAGKVNAMVLSVLHAMFTDTRLTGKAARDFSESQRDGSGERKSEVTRLRTQLRKAGERRAAVIDAEINAIEAGRDPEPYRVRLSRLEHEIGQTTARLSALEQTTSQHVALERDIEPWCALLSDAYAMVSSEELPEPERNIALRALIHHIFCDTMPERGAFADVYFHEHTPGFCYHARLKNNKVSVVLIGAEEMRATAQHR